MKLHFYGADRCVTGSCHCLEINGKRILVDCGLQQGRDELDNAMFAFNPGDIDILLVTHAISNLIRENKIFQIPSVIQTGHKLGMRSLNGSLLDIVQRDIVTPEEALFKSIDRNDLRKMFDENGIEYEASVTDEELM